ncbi:FecR family protein [Dyadobacter sp. CY343]|uniref:FecR family protein n=1 Tax=Dyadobacter sp. CY343 TaxID=2907299 RepID=UPI001F1D3F57|nr:FecR domain-containing protein [Dyadobacter sp. CY343]MCE7061135.1 FecR domain-containing protein [Dyadobacter sp. CY343]
MKRKLPKKGQRQDIKPEELSEEDRKTADTTRQLMQHIRHETLPPSEREYIWTQVEESIQQKKQIRMNRLWYSIAATVTLLLLAGLGYLNFRKDSGTVMRQLASNTAGDPENTKLVLADQRTINLERQNSSLVYEGNGNRIQIDSATAVDQEVAGQEFNTLIVPYGKRSVITLSDGTKIWVNSGSKLVYPAHFDSKQREVYVEGQAYFAVSHAADHPFFVHTKNMKVQVFGTEFDVSAYADDQQTSTVLVKGSIELTANQQSIFKAQKRKLEPGMRAVYVAGKGSLEVKQVNVGEYISWKDGYLALTRAPLAGILKKLARYYDVDIQLTEMESGSRTFSGTLDLQEDITKVLDIVAVGTSLTYQQSERRFVLGKSTITK